MTISPNRGTMTGEVKMTQRTLEQIGTPWAEEYRGSGRLTGRLSAEPTHMNTGEVAPGWVWVGDWTPDEFYAQFEEEEDRELGRRQ